MIKVNFSTYGIYVTDSLYQWDINRDLVINGLNLDQAPEIHFYNSNMEKAVVRSATLDNGIATVRIPNALLQEPLTIKADVCIYEDDVRKTIENIEIPVKAKARPLDYVFEDDGGEVYSYNELLLRIDEANRKLTEAIATYNELKDEYGRIIAELPSVPDRMTSLEATTPRITTTTYTGNGKEEAVIEYDKIPKVVIISEISTDGTGINFSINYGTQAVCSIGYQNNSTASISSEKLRVVWEDNRMIIRGSVAPALYQFNGDGKLYSVTILY